MPGPNPTKKSVETKALALAMIATNRFSIREISRQTGFDEGTLRNYRDALPEVLRTAELASNSEAMRTRANAARLNVFDHFLQTLVGGTKVLNRAIRQFENEDWIAKQDASGIAHGIREIRQSILEVAPLVAGFFPESEQREELALSGDVADAVPAPAAD